MAKLATSSIGVKKGYCGLNDSNSLIQVNEVDVEPDLEEEETCPKGGAEGTEKLDDINRQLLLDLMEEN